MTDLKNLCTSLRTAANILASMTADQKNRAIDAVIHAIDTERVAILEANKKDVEAARKAGVRETLVDRMSLSNARIDGMIDSLRIVIDQKDPVGMVPNGWTIENGLRIIKTRVPLGVASIIYESRPNVTVDAFAIAYKSGNALLLRGSSSAYESNKELVRVIKKGLTEAPDGIPNAVELTPIPDVPHADVEWILNAVGYIDVAIPRGGPNLIRRVVDTARVPTIETGAGNCHIYVDATADIEKAAAIVENAKMQRPGVCNAAENVLINRAIATPFLQAMSQHLAHYATATGRIGGCELRCDNESLTLLKKINAPQELVQATESDWNEEFLDYILAVKIVDSVEDAVSHINRHSTHHSEAIITDSVTAANYFKKSVDSACVYINASTRFTDGGVFGFGTELGISTQKLHQRGPMGLEALTSIKYIIDGDGQIR